uniref:Receptor ligand binding region domain-containing protein n=1 Tax=Aegilops tauschii subsp. strangulata TaxID=200361 RepID=A0A453CZ65_AEGTS
LWSYDTAWAIAAAVETARVPSPAFQTPGGTTALTDLDRLGVSATGTALLKAVLATTFEGIAGKFKMVDGQLQLPAYEVVNIIGRGARTVGFWTPEFGITQDLNPNSAKALRQILWPGEPWSAPKGWTVSPNGRMLLVAVPAKNGFKQFVDVSQNSTTGEEKITGYCIDVFDEVMKNLPYPVSYRYVPQNVSLDSYDKLVDLVRDQEIRPGRGRRDGHREQDGRSGLHDAIHRVGVVDGRGGAGGHGLKHVGLRAAAKHRPLARQPRLLLLHRLCRVGDRAPDQPRVSRHALPAVRPHLLLRLLDSHFLTQGEAAEQSVEVHRHHVGVCRLDPDVELHGEPDVDADRPEAPADGDRREGAPEKRPLHRVPGGQLHRILAPENGLRPEQDEEVQLVQGVRRRAIQRLGEGRGRRGVRRDPVPEALPVGILQGLHDGRAHLQDCRPVICVPEGFSNDGGRVAGYTDAGGRREDVQGREGVVRGAGCVPATEQRRGRPVVRPKIQELWGDIPLNRPGLRPHAARLPRHLRHPRAQRAPGSRGHRRLRVRERAAVEAACVAAAL